MKYIKLFERKQEFKVGDYVKIKLIPNFYAGIVPVDINDKNNLYVKIASISEPFYSFKLPSTFTIYGNESLIDRKMNKKEVEYYKIREETEKYNL